jgi:hypothetical protein
VESALLAAAGFEPRVDDSASIYSFFTGKCNHHFNISEKTYADAHFMLFCNSHISMDKVFRFMLVAMEDLTENS